MVAEDKTQTTVAMTSAMALNQAALSNDAQNVIARTAKHRQNASEVHGAGIGTYPSPQVPQGHKAQEYRIQMSPSYPLRSPGGRPKTANARHPFYENLIFTRKNLPDSAFDEKSLALVIPCYNEIDEVTSIVENIRDEVKFFLHDKQVDHLAAYFVVDGSSSDQLLTAQMVVQSLSERFHGNDKISMEQTSGSLQESYDELQNLLTVTRRIHQLTEACDDHLLNVEQQEEIENERWNLQQAKSNVFATSHTRNSHGFAYYNTRLLKYDFSWRCEKHKGEDSRTMTIDFIILVKEENKQKRDSLLLALHCCFVNPRIPWTIGFVDSDTCWTKGSLNRMRTTLGLRSNLAAVSGSIKARNETWYNPVTTMEDFLYLSTDMLTKEADHLFGMVNHCPGQFSMFKVLPATDPDIVLPQLTKYAITIEEKHQYELGVHQFWTTLLLEKCLQQSIFNTDASRIAHISSAVAETDVPRDIISYIVQQRRWINSTNANLTFGLMRKTARHMINVFNPRWFGIVYILLRTFLTQLSFYLAPSLVSILAISLFDDVNVDQSASLSIIMGVFLILAPVIVMLFPRPSENPFFYQLYSAMTSLGAAGLIVYWAVTVITDFTTLEWQEDNLFLASQLRKAILLVFFALIIGLVVCHRQIRRAFSPVYKPLLAIATIPIHYVLMPCYCFVDVSDVSWGNRDIRISSTAAEIEAAQRKARAVFFWFLLSNWLVFSLYFIALYGIQGDSVLALYLAVEVLLFSPLLVTCLCSFLSAVKYFLTWPFRKLQKCWHRGRAN